MHRGHACGMSSFGGAGARGISGSVSRPQSQQPVPPSQHLPKPRGDAALKMRASLRMTRYLESWGAQRPFAHLTQRESLSSSETPLPDGRRPKVPVLWSWARDAPQRGQRWGLC